MLNLKTVLFAVAGILALNLIWSVISVYTDLRTFKDEVLAQQAQLSQLVRKQERLINATVLQATEQSAVALDSINADYTALLDERKRMYDDHAADKPGVSSASAASNGASDTTAGRPSQANTRLFERIKRCEARLIYEAKEYDILATHYNALLSIYQKAYEVSNGNSEKDDR